MPTWFTIETTCSPFLLPRVQKETVKGGETGAGDEQKSATAEGIPSRVSYLGSMLFTRCVSGTRVVARGQRKSVAGVEFEGYGASVKGYPHDYLTAACALGLSLAELDEFLVRLDKTIRKVKGKKAGNAKVYKRVGPGPAEKVANGAEGNGVIDGGERTEPPNELDCISRSVSASECEPAAESETIDWDGVD